MLLGPLLALVQAVEDLVVARELLDVVEVSHFAELWRRLIVVWCKKHSEWRSGEAQQGPRCAVQTSLYCVWWC